jgi:probable F420-dependent oxidoreductase
MPAGGRLHYWLNTLEVPATELLPLARRAEQLGFAGVAVADHLVVPARIDTAYPGGVRNWDQQTDWPDPWVSIGAMAGATTRLRFVTNVYVLPIRDPLVTAKAAATAAVLSGGRVVLGAGVGWMAEEFRQLGLSFRTRGARTDEIIAILRRAWATGRVEFHGRFYDFDEVHVRPVPAQPVPLWIGGESERAVDRAARLGDGWISGRTLPEVAPLINLLHRRRQEAGRDTLPFDVAVSARQAPSPVERADLERAGVGHLKVQPWATGPASASLDDKLGALDAFAARYL